MSSSDVSTANDNFEKGEKGTFSRKGGVIPWVKAHRWTSVGLVALAVALAIGLGVGLDVGLNQADGDADDGSDDSNSGSSTSPYNGPTTNNTNLWQPSVGSSWNYQLFSAKNDTNTNNITVWFLDLFNTDASIIKGMQQNGSRIICYFSAGSYENWRPDKDQFKDADLGKTLDGWPDEKWLQTNSPNVRSIMIKRLDMAVTKGCDGVDPDNVDGYSNKNGLGLSKNDSINYLEFLANETSARNLSIGLKNGGDLISSVLGLMQWVVNEQCEEFDECDTFQPFIQANKPVYHVEYPKGDQTDNNVDVAASIKTKVCNGTNTNGFSTIMKNMNLDTWIEAC